MNPYPKSPFSLSELAQHYFNELQTVFSNAVSFEELFKPKKIRRPKNHSSSASLAYRIENEKEKHSGPREELAFHTSQAYIRKHFKVNVLPIEDPYELYWMEVTLAAMFGAKYNEFKTH